MTTLIQYELIDPDTEREHEYDCAPCPFCGSERVEFVAEFSLMPMIRHSVQCVTCDARGPACREYAQAVERWNAAERKFSKQAV